LEPLAFDEYCRFDTSDFGWRIKQASLYTPKESRSIKTAIFIETLKSYNVRDFFVTKNTVYIAGVPVLNLVLLNPVIAGRNRQPLVPRTLEPKMEQMDVAAVAAWFADELKLPQYVVATKEHEIDGAILLDLVEQGKLAALEITNDIHQAKVRVALTKLGRKRAAEGPAGGTAVARAKRARLAEAEAEVTPGPAAAATVTAAEGGGMEQAAFQQVAAQLELAAPAPPAQADAEATPVFVAQSAAHGRHFYVSKPSEEFLCDTYIYTYFASCLEHA